MCQAYWLIDLIISHQCHKNVNAEPFQVWDLKKANDDPFTIIATDGNHNQSGNSIQRFSLWSCHYMAGGRLFNVALWILINVGGHGRRPLFLLCKIHIMKAIKIPKQDRKAFLEAARSQGIEFSCLNKIIDPEFEYYHTDKMNISQNDLFELGVLYHKLKLLQHNHQ